jgi:CRP-like cAMP-binding protein
VNHLSKIIKSRHVAKRGYLLRPGEVCEHIFFIERGLLRCFYLSGETEVTSWLRREGRVVVSIDSYYDQVPSYEFIQAVEDTDLFYITFEEEQEVFNRFLEYNFIGRLLTQFELRDFARDLRNIRMHTAIERYEMLLKNDPELVRRVPNIYLASYLNMTTETLSRIRGQLS